MRQIKFRAWDKREGKWLFGYELPNLGGFSMFGEIMLMGEWSALLSSRFPNELEEIELTQYTGLKDKNGKEIYENDVLRTSIANQFGSKTEELGLVTWHEDAGQTVLKSLKHNGVTNIGFDVEVIGNIYENPELLAPSQQQ